MTRLNLLFDLDGTLTDSRDGIVHSILFALEQVGLHGFRAGDLDWCVGPPLVESLAKILGPNRSHLAPQALELYQRRYGEIGILENRPFNGIRDCLRELDGSAELYVVTSNLTRFSLRTLDYLGLDGHFKRIHGCADWSGADKCRLIAELLRLEGIDPATAVMIGDRRHDIRGAQENRVASIGVLWGYGGKTELEEAGAQVVLAHPRELTEHFKHDRFLDRTVGKAR